MTFKDIARRRLQEALPPPPPNPALLGRIMARLPDRGEGMPFPRLAVALTGVLAILIMAGFVYLGQGIRRPVPQAPPNPPACQLPVLSTSAPGHLHPSTANFRPDHHVPRS